MCGGEFGSSEKSTSRNAWRTRVGAVPKSRAGLDHVRRLRPLVLDGELLKRRHDRRREALDSLGLTGAHWTTVPVYDNPDCLLDACAELGLEGIVAKRIDTTYRHGERSRHWIKRKTPGWREIHAARGR